MISLEQVQLLESRVAKAIEYVQRVTAENQTLSSERAALLEEKQTLLEEKTLLSTKLEANKKRLDELETLVMKFKEDQGRIEDGIMAALDRLSQFEEAFESGLKEQVDTKKQTAKKEKTAEKEQEQKNDSSASKEFFEIEKEEETDELDIF